MSHRQLYHSIFYMRRWVWTHFNLWFEMIPISVSVILTRSFIRLALSFLHIKDPFSFLLILRYGMKFKIIPFKSIASKLFIREVWILKHSVFSRFLFEFMQEATFVEVINWVKDIISKISHVLAHHSPILIVQRWIKGYLTRKKIGYVYSIM